MTSSNEMLPKYDFICGNLFTQNANHISPKRQSQWLLHLLWTNSKAARRHLYLESCNFCNFVFSQLRCQAVRLGEGNQSRPLLLGLFLIFSSSLVQLFMFVLESRHCHCYRICCLKSITRIAFYGENIIK